MFDVCLCALHRRNVFRVDAVVQKRYSRWCRCSKYKVYSVCVWGGVVGPVCVKCLLNVYLWMKILEWTNHHERDQPCCCPHLHHILWKQNRLPTCIMSNFYLKEECLTWETNHLTVIRGVRKHPRDAFKRIEQMDRHALARIRTSTHKQHSPTPRHINAFPPQHTHTQT